MFFFFVCFLRDTPMIVDTESSVFSTPGLPSHAMRLCPDPLHLRAHGRRRPASRHTNGRTREKKTLASCATGPYLPPPPRPQPLPSLILPTSPPPSSDPPYVTNVCCLGPSLCLRRELFFFLLIFSVNDLKWIINLYIFIIRQTKRKDCSSVIVI